MIADGSVTAPARAHAAPRALRLLLPAAVLLPLLVAAAGAWLSWRQAWREAELETAQAAETSAEYLRRVLDGLVLRIDRAQDVLAGLADEEISAREAELHAALRRVAASGLPQELRDPYLFVYDRDAFPLVSGNVYPVPRQRSFAEREFNQALRGAGAAVHVSAPVLGAVTGEAFFAISRRRERTGNPAAPEGYDGVVNASVYVRDAEEALRRIASDRTGDVLSVIRADGVVLARSLPVPLGTRVGESSPMLAAMRRGEARAFGATRSTLDGEWRIAAYRRVEGYPIYTAAARPRAVVLRRWGATVVPIAAAGLPAALALVWLAVLARRSQAALLGLNGELERRVAERGAALRLSEARARLAMEGARLGTWDFDVRAGRGYWSARLAEIYGDVPAERHGVGFAEWAGRLHPDDRPEAEAVLRGCFAPGGPDRFAFEVRLRGPGATWRWVAVRGAVIERDAAGDALRATGIGEDVTERRRAEERQRLLAHEVDHRAKNALAVVLSAVRLTPRRDAGAFAAAVEGRVEALARTHTLLAQGRWLGAELRAIIEGELRAFVSPEGPRAELSGPAVWLEPAAAQALSMALHELATNAAKYGALSVRSGLVRLAWETGPGDWLRLAWTETGGPRLVEGPGRRGFGSRVIEATVQEQLGGRVSREWNAEGLVCEIAVPLGGAAPREAAPRGAASGVAV